MKKFISLILSLVFTLSLTACGEDTVQSVIEDARDFLKDARSVHCSSMTGMDISDKDGNSSSFLTMEADLDIERKTSYVNMVSTADDEELALEMYVDTSATPPNYFVGSGDKWLRLDSADLDANMDFDTDLNRDFDVYFNELAQNPDTELTVEELEGDKYFKLYAPVTIRSLDMAKQFSMESFITGYLGENPSADMVTSVLELLGPVDVTVYVNCKTDEPYGFVVDFKPALDTFYQKLQLTDITVTEAYATSIYTYYNESEVEIPEKVLNAQNMSEVSDKMGGN